MEDVIKYPNERWDRDNLSQNNNICMDVIRMNLPNATEDWNWECISRRISLEDVIKYPNEKWDKEHLYANELVSNSIVDIILSESRENIHERLEESRIQSLIGYHDILSCVRNEGKNDVSTHKLISIDIMDHIDRVGMNVSKWNRDIDIMCIC
jgi:hypothetical protein